MKYYHYMVVILMCVIISVIMSMLVIEEHIPVPRFVRKNIMVDDLTGKTGETAGLKVAIAQLKLNMAGEEYTAEAPQGMIFRQSPAKGSLLKRGESVDVWISKGSIEVIVPAVKGMTPEAAEAELKNNSIMVSGRESVNTRSVKKGRVVTSKPPAGTRVVRDTGVILVVSGGTNLVTVPGFTGKSLSQTKNLIRKASLKLGMIKKETDPEYEFDTILRQHPKKGKRVKPGTSVTVVLNVESE